MARIDGWKMQFFSTKGTVCEALWHFGNDVVDFFMMLPGRYSNLNQFLHSKKSCRRIHVVVFLTAILHRGLRNDFFFNSNLLFPIFIWTFIFPFLFGLLFPLFSFSVSTFIQSSNFLF